MHKKLF